MVELPWNHLISARALEKGASSANEVHTEVLDEAGARARAATQQPL